jgi:hypothetical protein
VGTVERGLLPAAQQCAGLGSGRTLTGLHSSDRGRGRISHAEIEPKTSADLGQQTEASRGGHSRVLPGLRVVEEFGATLSSRRVGMKQGRCFRNWRR